MKLKRFLYIGRVTLGQLRTFLAVARAGSIRGAAAALVVTEPAVSAALSALSRELGVPLTARHGRGIRLTEAGEELTRYAARILGLADRAGRAVREAAERPGHVRLAAVTTAGEYVLPPLLATFLGRHPGVQLSLEVGNRADAIERLLADEVDLAVGGRPPGDGEIEGFPFLENALVVVAGANHPLGRRRGIDPAHLSRETWLLREQGSGTRDTALEFLAGGGMEPASTLNVGSNGAVKRAAALGLGITLISAAAVRAELASGELVRLRVRGTPLRRRWYVLYRRETALPRSARAFVDLLRGERLPGRNGD